MGDTKYGFFDKFILNAFTILPTLYARKIAAITPKKHNVKIAVIAVPEFAGQETCDKLVSLGIKGILNFSPVILRVPDDVYVNNVNLRSEIESLFYYT